MDMCRGLLSGDIAIIYPEGVEPLVVHQQLDAAVDAWQRINTAVFWHVLASVDLKTSYAPQDMRIVKSLYNRQLANGVGLLRFLRRFSDTGRWGVQASSSTL